MTTPPLDLPALREYAKELERDGARSGTIRTDVLRALLDRVEAAERDLAAVTVSRDGWQPRAERAESANDRIRGLHAPTTVLEAWGSISRSYGNSDACLHCTSEDDSTPTLYPCPTITALDNHTPETETTP